MPAQIENNRLIIVSNRLPFHISERKGELVFSPSSGGLVSSIKSYIDKKSNPQTAQKENQALWIGSAEISEAKFRAYAKGGNLSCENFVLHPLFLPRTTKDKYYNGFCNNVIWPLFHYFPSYVKYQEDLWNEYVNANQAYCDKINAIYKPGDLIWVHDYHLMLLPGMLRKKLPEASIGFFLHIPFPSFELFRLLPNRWRRALLEGILGADLAGFHTNNYVQYFLKSVQQILGYENTLRTITAPDRIVTADTFPVSIDYEKFTNAFNNHDVFEERNKVKRKLTDKKIVTSVDRLDYAKGIINRLEGFELFLSQHPEFIKKVVYILIVVPSRDIITRYKESKQELEGLVSRINGQFGSIDWTPVVYQYKALDFKKLCALYIAADAALIAPLRDGLNLVAKEFVASRRDKRGVLILSETAGASAELGEAIIINPTDRQEVADSIFQALNMPVEEQMERNHEMQKRLQTYDVVRWAEDFISQLRLVKSKQELLTIKEVSPEIEQKIMVHYRQANRRIIFLDYDGTLAPFAKLPHLAAPERSLHLLLHKLSCDLKNTIVLISGRQKDVLEEWFSEMKVNLVAEHGAFFKLRSSTWMQAHSLNLKWKTSVLPVMKRFTERCSGTFVEEKVSSLAWHFRNAEKELGFLRSRELINALTELSAHLNFQVMEGQKVIEARARGVDKGTAAASFLINGTNDFILAIGDDRTDEDLFKAIPENGYSIRVGLLPSSARFNFIQQKDVLLFLNKLAGDKQPSPIASGAAGNRNS
jgi:trehalose 6-phosphate synthase/phosphatase